MDAEKQDMDVVMEKSENLEGGGIKRAREDEQKGKTEEGSQKAQKISANDTPSKAFIEKEKVEDAEEVDEKGEEPPLMKEVPPISEPRAPEDTHEEVKSLERGHIFFFYRPKVGKEASHNFAEVQKTYIILYPVPFPFRHEFDHVLIVLPGSSWTQSLQAADRAQEENARCQQEN